MMLSASIYISMTWVDTIMIGVYMDTESVGTYNTVLKVSLIANMVMAAVNSVSATEFSEMWSQNRIKELNLYIKKNTKYKVIDNKYIEWPSDLSQGHFFLIF